MAEYNGVRIEPLSDGGQDLNYQVEQFIFLGCRPSLCHISFVSKIQQCCTMHKCYIHGNSHCSFI